MVLSKRQVQILPLVAAGMTNEAIGHELHLGADTVRTHIKHAFARTRAKNRAQFVTWGYETGLLRRESAPSRGTQRRRASDAPE